MSANNTYGTILIRDNTLLPAALAVESEAFLPGWRMAKNLDGYGLARKMEEAKWNYFYLAGVTRTMVLGGEGPETIRRAVRRALRNGTGCSLTLLKLRRLSRNDPSAFLHECRHSFLAYPRSD